MKLLPVILIISASLAISAGVTGPFPPAAGQAGSDAIAANDPRFLDWAKEVVSLVRGNDEMGDPLSLPVTYGSASSALGPADVLNPQNQPAPGQPGPYPVVSLGDGGSITLRFDPPIADGAGPDFAVFENGLSDTFLELAFVEVSSDGIHFVRFPAISNTQTLTQIDGFGALDARDLKNFAGKYRAGFGTPFDLAELAGNPQLNVQAVTQVRLVNVVGSVDPALGSRDSLGHLVNDLFPTPYESGGFDLDAIGVLHQAVTTYGAWAAPFNWSASQALPDADPDGDGVPNVLEYAAGTDPLRPTPPPAPIISRQGNEIQVSISCRSGATDLVCGLEISTDLKSWEPAPGPAILLTDGMAPAAGYFRLAVRLKSAP